jgi:hypothetical protein
VGRRLVDLLSHSRPHSSSSHSDNSGYGVCRMCGTVGGSVILVVEWSGWMEVDGSRVAGRRCNEDLGRGRVLKMRTTVGLVVCEPGWADAWVGRCGIGGTGDISVGAALESVHARGLSGCDSSAPLTTGGPAARGRASPAPGCEL